MSRNHILLVDDHAMVREGLRLLLKHYPELDCEVSEAASLQQAILLLDESPEIAWVLLDLGLGEVAGIEALHRLRARHGQTPVVVLTSSDEPALIVDCINAGAMGFISKSANSAELSRALLTVFSGGIYLPPSFITGDMAPTPPVASRNSSRDYLARLALTPRQIEVLELLLQGLSNKRIAQRLGLAEPTVKSHVAAGLRALNVKNRTQAVLLLARAGFGFQ